jgi:hypothetical protein
MWQAIWFPPTGRSAIQTTMLPKQESLPAVTTAAIVAIIFGTLGVLGGLLLEVSVLLIPDVRTPAGSPAMPPGTKSMVGIVWLFFIAVAVFGIFVGVGIIRRRNWARISILVWGGFMAVVSAITIPMLFFIFSSMPAMMPKDADAAPILGVMKWITVLFYGIPLGVGIWWLVLFTRPRVSAAFTAPVALAPYPPVMDVSGFPLPQPTASVSVAPKPACPLPLAILAGFMIFGAVCLALFAFVPLPSDVPFFFFGQAFGRGAGRIILILFGIISGVTGIGIFKLKPWALYTQIAFQCVGLLNCIVTFLSPSYAPAMRAAMEKMYSQDPALVGSSPFLSDTYFRSGLILAAVFVGAVLAVLLWQRSRFLAQAAAATAARA